MTRGDEPSQATGTSPVFVVGFGRSGTSALAGALGRHPLIVTADGEAPLIAQVGSLVYPYLHGRKVDYYHDSLAIPWPRFCEQLRTLCRTTALGEGRDLGGVRYWCAKAFPDEQACTGLRGLFSGCRFIYIHRRGDEVVRSGVKFGFGAHSDDPFTTICESWAAHVERYAYLQSLDAAITIRHGDFLADPATELQRIFTFLELPADDQPIEFARSTLVLSLDQQTRAGVDVKEALANRPPPDADWTPDQRETFERLCGDAMARLGYA